MSASAYKDPEPYARITANARQVVPVNNLRRNFRTANALRDIRNPDTRSKPCPPRTFAR